MVQPLIFIGDSVTTGGGADANGQMGGTNRDKCYI